MYFKIEYISKGTIKEVVISAKSYSDALKKFKAKKLGILKSIEPIQKPSLLKEIAKKLDISRVDLEEFIAILEQMYVMLDAGIAIDLVIDNIRKEVKNKKLKNILTSIQKDIQSGHSLTSAFSKFENELGKLTVAMIRLGEETGDLAKAIKDLSIILSEILDNRKRLKKASRYPVFIIFAMSIAFVVVVLFVIPPFKSMFMSLQTELPLPTRFLLWLENALERYGLYILAGALVIFGVLSYLYNTRYKVRLFMDKLMLKIFIIGDVIKLAMLGRFIYVFQKLVDSGIPILDAVDIALNIVENEYIKKQLHAIKANIQTGSSIKAGFEESKMFESMIVQMIGAGEESGALVEMLQKVSKYYLEKYRYMVDNISTLIEPILIAAIAGFVVTLALGIFLPMWNLTQVLH
jgi:general secretion pathway protein F